MIYFVVQPMPGSVVIKQIVFDGILMVILGIIVAWLYRGTRMPQRAAVS
jgi:ABC-type Fe3+ transport system permease subunit